MHYIVNGRIVAANTAADGSVGSDANREAAGVPDERPLIIQLPDGRIRKITPGEELSLRREQFFVDVPRRCGGPNVPGETAPPAVVRSIALPNSPEGTKSPTSSRQEE